FGLGALLGGSSGSSEGFRSWAGTVTPSASVDLQALGGVLFLALTGEALTSDSVGKLSSSKWRRFFQLVASGSLERGQTAEEFQKALIAIAGEDSRTHVFALAAGFV